jgi:hypothetical protein
MLDESAQPQPLSKAPHCFDSARKLEAKHPAMRTLVLKFSDGSTITTVFGETRVMHPCDDRLILEPSRERVRRLRLSAQAKRKRLESEQCQPGIERGLDRPGTLADETNPIEYRGIARYDRSTERS